MEVYIASGRVVKKNPLKNKYEINARIFMKIQQYNTNEESDKWLIGWFCRLLKQRALSVEKVMTGLIWFALLHSVIGSKHSRQFLNQSEIKFKSNHPLINYIFPSFGRPLGSLKKLPRLWQRQGCRRQCGVVVRCLPWVLEIQGSRHILPLVETRWICSR